MDKKYRVGLDIGIGSVGFAVIENDPQTEEPVRIIELGSRTFDTNEVQKTGASTALDRRIARGVRRRKRRKQFRFERAKKLLCATFGDDILKQVDALKNADVYEIRNRAIDEKVTNAELAKAILNLLARRGFKSNRKNISNKEDGELKAAIAENQRFLQDKGYRTIGEAIFKDARYKIEVAGNLVYNVRNHGGDYRNSFMRSDLKNELELILQKQAQLGNEAVTPEFCERIIDIFDSQRNFDIGPGQGSPYSAKFKIGTCTFIEGEPRAPKASYTFEFFNAISKINNLKIDGEPLSLEEKQSLYELAKENKEITFKQVRKLINLPFGKYFNLCNYTESKKKKDEEQTLSQEEFTLKCEEKALAKLDKSYSIKKALNLVSSFDNADLINRVALMLTTCKSDNTIDEFAKNDSLLRNLTPEQLDAVKKLDFKQVGSLSIKAMNLVIPYLLQGERYDVACKSAGYNHSSFETEKIKYLKGEKLEQSLQDITNNVVKRSVNQTLRVLNKIIEKYGSPQFVTIELARELAKTKQERNKIDSMQTENMQRNEDIAKHIMETYKMGSVSGLDILKFRLYEEQNGKCMYSGHRIEEDRLFEPNYTQIDHILPFSKSFNDSYNNKVLVIADENQNKGDRTPFEYFGNYEKKWASFVARVMGTTGLSKAKRKNLLKEHITESEQKDFIDRNINDTRYLSKLLREIMDKYLLLNESKTSKKQVRCINGGITYYLRKCWGINKVREDGDTHHAVDAAVIALATDKQVKRISVFNKFKEKFYVRENGTIINRETGEVISKEELERLKDEQIEPLKSKLPYPYDGFFKELEIRSKSHYFDQSFSNDEKLELAKLGYSEEEIDQAKPIFVSRMKTVKLTGAIHEQTIMSTREYKETKRLIKTVALDKLKLKSIAEKTPLKDDKHPDYSIENYYKPESDRLLYLKLKEIMFQNGGSVPKNTIIYKPCKDGTDGPIVRKVKTYLFSNKCVMLPNGAASNDRMHRVDVFEKDGKFYLCPVYFSDVYAKRLPNKVIVRDKDWLTIDKTYNFKFSLYKNDLVKIVSKRDIVLTKNFKDEKSKKPDKISSKEFLLYYNGTDIHTASAELFTNDKCYSKEGVGVKTLKSIEKYYVDITGKIYKALPEKRKHF